MTRPARARTWCKGDKARPSEHEVTLDRAAQLLVVRGLRRPWRTRWELPLGVVAQMVVERCVKAALLEKRRAKAEARKARRGGRP